MQNLSIPHGGKIINRLANPSKVASLKREARSLLKIKATEQQLADIELIANGGFSPLEGFMNSKDYYSVINNIKLSNNLIWSIPITFNIQKKASNDLKENSQILIIDKKKSPIAILNIKEIFEIDLKEQALKVFKTDEKEHPAVGELYKNGNVALAGKITVLKLPERKYFHPYEFTPSQARALFNKKGWKTVVAFQTRNPVHRAHEYIQKCALEIADGLLLHPIVGFTKADDIPVDVRMECYQVLLKNYFPSERIQLSVLPAAMRYGGPREAIHHAIMRKNYGCTHFIVGRDHAGVGDYYGTFDAHKIFDSFNHEELGITPLFFDYTFYCKKCQGMASTKTCPHDHDNHVFLSGTKVREMLKKGITPPKGFSREEVAKVLIDWQLNKKKVKAK